jgi:hypothetical protein
MVLNADLSHQDYTARQFRELEPDRLLERAMVSRPSGNYRYNHLALAADGRGETPADGVQSGTPTVGDRRGILADGDRREVASNGAEWAPQPYPGFAVVSMVDENPGNTPLPDALKAIQVELLEQCPWEGCLYPLPASSFHQTVANTLSEERFLQYIVRAGLEPVYPDLIAMVFEKMPVRPASTLPMRLIGLSIFGTALGILGVFDNEADYCRILDFRSAFYADPGLQALDIRMTRPFIGHITLAYIEADLNTRQREELAAAVHRINRSLGNSLPAFNLSLAGLRRYHHLSAFLREVDYPQYHL